MIMRRHIRAALLSTCVFAAASACDGGSQDATPPSGTADVTSSSAPIKTINGTLLTTVQLGTDHTLEFYELQDGQNMVFESMPMGTGTTLLHGLNPTSLAEVYRAANADATEVPSALLAADAHATEIAATLPEPVESVPPVSQGATDLAASTMIDKACSPDAYGDNWGENWFLVNFCDEGNFSYCDGNWTAYHFNNWTTNWLKWSVMAADFWYGARTSGGHYYEDCSACPWGCFLCASTEAFRWDFNVQIPPRQIVEYTYTTRGKRSVHAVGDDPCPRIHYAFMYK
jgi:hypothetical protein